MDLLRLEQSPGEAMSQSLPLQLASAFTEHFLAEVLPKAPSRVEAEVSSQDGMPLLCAIEAVLGATLARTTSQELVWLGNASAPGRHVIKLRAFQSDNVVVGEVVHELET
jgi:hypothetical protein